MMQSPQFSDSSSLQQRMDATDELTPDLVFFALSATCPPIPDERTLPLYNELRRFVHQGAWLRAVECLIDIRLPRWRIQRISCENGRWTCVLCLRWSPNEQMNAVCIGEHATFELAILMAYLHATGEAFELERPLANVLPIRPAAARPSVVISSKAR